MSEFADMQDQFLIAMPTLANDFFYHSVIYICEHNEEGATGIIINHPLELQLKEIFDRMEINDVDLEVAARPILLGGPLHPERGFVLHSGTQRWRSTFKINKDLSITTSRDILEAMAAGNEPDDVLITLGYAGWGAGQLEEELANNFWLSAPATHEILFNMPYPKRWNAAAALLGIDINTISGLSGHA